MKNNKILGQIGEKIAQDYLVSKGYNITETNYRIREGEIDIIATKNDTLVFVEVKTRRGEKYGKGYHAISPLKSKTIQKVAENYIAGIKWTGIVRILAISINYRTNTSYDIEVVDFFN